VSSASDAVDRPNVTRADVGGESADRRRRFEAVAALVDEPVQRYLGRRASADDAADVLAETLLVVWRRLDDVPDEPLPWCFGVARRCLANHRRGTQRRLRLVDRLRREPDPPPEPDPDHDVDGDLDRARELDPELARALATLTAHETEIVHLWAWEQLEPREIAEVVGATPNAVSVALARAKRKLRAELGERQDHDHDGHPVSVDTDEHGRGKGGTR
jgi:RNA polymerase sigma-70 factor (ECF subfamily)